MLVAVSKICHGLVCFDTLVPVDFFSEERICKCCSDKWFDFGSSFLLLLLSFLLSLPLLTPSAFLLTDYFFFLSSKYTNFKLLLHLLKWNLMARTFAFIFPLKRGKFNTLCYIYVYLYICILLCAIFTFTVSQLIENLVFSYLFFVIIFNLFYDLHRFIFGKSESFFPFLYSYW